MVFVLAAMLFNTPYFKRFFFDCFIVCMFCLKDIFNHILKEIMSFDFVLVLYNEFNYF